MKKLLTKRTIVLLLSCTLIYSTHAYTLGEVKIWTANSNKEITEFTRSFLNKLNQYTIESELRSIDPRIVTSTLSQKDLANLITAISDIKEKTREQQRNYRQPELSQDSQTLLNDLNSLLTTLQKSYPNEQSPTTKRSKSKFIEARNNVITQLLDRFVAILQSYQSQQ